MGVDRENGEVYVQGLCRRQVSQATDAQKVLEKALQQRCTKATDMNDASSRSHCICILRYSGTKPPVTTSENNNGGSGSGGRSSTRRGCVNFCDLAGSERMNTSSGNLSGSSSSSSKHCQQELHKETRSINKSLSALGLTISALASGNQHIPFRDSKLTYLLQGCLTGFGKCLMLCTLVPDAEHTNESLGSLRFAQNASKVTIKGQRCNQCSGLLKQSSSKSSLRTSVPSELKQSSSKSSLRSSVPSERRRERSLVSSAE